jgi:protein-S-isoprenylcysteine O-methyltransferase Ste14
MYLGIVVSLLGIALVLVGWRKIHQEYWRMEAGEGKLVQTGIYRHIRHPQYIGFFLITFGMMLEWVTIPLLILYVLLLVLYYRLAKREEADMVKEFGEDYIEYKKRTKMFIPHLI